MDNAQAFERVNRALQRLPADQHTEEMRRLQQYEQELGITAALARGAAAAGRLPPEVAFKAIIGGLEECDCRYFWKPITTGFDLTRTL